MPKAGTGKRKEARHDPLHVQIDADASLRRFGRVSAPDKRKKQADDGAEDEQVCLVGAPGSRLPFHHV